ncbi:alpha/beta hydrolase family protein [Chitinophaga agrisoli]|nr:prolyl oligopeptidase family serine peptidase [Chitinophaga agrisoli]
MLDTGVFDRWPEVQSPAITPDGRYMCYTIYRQPAGSQTLVIRSLRDSWEKALPGAAMAAFTPSGGYLVFLQGGDSLCLLQPGAGQAKFIDRVGSFWQFDNRGRSWLAWYSATAPIQLVIYDIDKGRPQTIWTGKTAGNLVVDTAGAQLAFTADGKVWYYHHGMPHARPLLAADSALAGITLVNFSMDGKRILCLLPAGNVVKPWPQAPGRVQIWRYTDAVLPPCKEKEAPVPCFAVISLKDLQLTRLQEAGEELWPITGGATDKWGLIIRKQGSGAVSRYYLISLVTGRRKEVDFPFAGISPAGRFLVSDDGLGNIHTYELATGITRDVTADISVPAGDAGYDQPALAAHRGLGSWGHWLPGDTGILLYDRYDNWLADPLRQKAPINLTNGYGRRHHITFRLIAPMGTVVRLQDTLILDAFNNDNKDNGFYCIRPDSARDPLPLTMGPYLYYAKEHFYLGGEAPLKARNAGIYIVRRCSATASPNYFMTQNFKRFRPLSTVYPERSYNWLQSQLMAFTLPDGRKEQGILYTPQDFDPHKKYPVLLHYYEIMADRLHRYQPPAFSAGDINIPYFVSRGYLVFTPDLHFTTGAAGSSACITVIAAAGYLSRLPYVRADKMGITSRSFGGFLTNYIVTHSNLFAAACSDAGIVNMAGGWGTYELNTGMPLQELYERSYYRMGAPPWQQPDLYLENSPLFMADKVTTPLLLVHNKLDAVVPVDQGIAFFTALHRLGKPAWLLQYEGEAHNLLQPDNQLDLTIRINQFFDHFLKDAAAPDWMHEVDASGK